MVGAMDEDGVRQWSQREMQQSSKYGGGNDGKGETVSGQTTIKVGEVASRVGRGGFIWHLMAAGCNG
jgi:hypothetical protein